MKKKETVKKLIQILENANEAWKFDECKAIFSLTPFILEKIKKSNAKLNKNQLKVVLESVSYLTLNYRSQQRYFLLFFCYFPCFLLENTI